MEYAPVIIPTLNRFNHLKRCLESLEQCSGAGYTAVYVGLDYPPSECYEEGWREVTSYLEYKKDNNRFRSFNVFQRSINFGIHAFIIVIT